MAYNRNIKWLYTFRILYTFEDNPEKNYDWVIISDSLNGIIKGIANRHMVFSLDNFAKKFSVEKYVVVKQEDGRNYYIFDAYDNLNISHGAMFDICRMYDCVIENEHIKSVNLKKWNKLFHDMQCGCVDVSDVSYILGDALFTSNVVTHAIDKLQKEKRKNDMSEKTIASSLIDSYIGNK